MPRKTRDRFRIIPPKLPPLPRLAKLPVRPKGPRALQPLLKLPEVLNADTPGPMPAGMVATTDEWFVYWWLDRHHIHFDFQSSLMGGRIQLGGIVADFMLPTMKPPMIIQVQGLHWHYGPFADELKDQRQRDILTNQGYVVVAVDEDDVLNRLNWVMERALRGEDVSRAVWSR